MPNDPKSGRGDPTASPIEPQPPPLTTIREPALPRKELRIVLLYVVFASLWIVGSDMVIEWLGTHPAHAIRFQMLKGLNFVGTTAVLLYIALQRSFNRWRRAEDKVRRSSDKLRALSAKLQFLREEERSRIAREIHDELGQMLTALKMDLRWIEGRLSQDPDTTLNPVLEKSILQSEQRASSRQMRRKNFGFQALALRADMLALLR